MAWLLIYLTDLRMLFLMLAIFTLLEVIAPRGKPSLIARVRGVGFYLIYFVAAAFAAGAVGIAASWLHLRPLIDTDNLAVVIAYPLIWDFFYYWFHRAQHAIPALWKLHSVHHAIRDLTAANSYHHWSEEILRGIAMGLPLVALVRVSPVEFAWVNIFLLAAGSLIHTQTAFSLGPINRILADNRTHRLHHSLEERHWDRNFGLTTIWDQLFRTAYFPAKDEWPETGLADRAETASLSDYLLARESRSRSVEVGVGVELPVVHADVAVR